MHWALSGKPVFDRAVRRTAPIAVTLCCAVPVFGQASPLAGRTQPPATVIAITGGTLYPVSGLRIENGTVIITNDRITAVGADVSIPANATRVDASGKWVTPGFVNAITTLGLSEAGSPQFSGGYNDTQATVNDRISASFDVVDGFNPASTLIRPASQDGITTVGVFPGGNWFAGKGAVVDLSGNTVGAMLVGRGVGMYVNMNVAAAGTGARAAMWGRLRELLDDVRQYRLRRVQFEAGSTRSFITSRSQLDALLPVLAGTMPLFAAVDRASDIRTMLAIAREYGLALVIVSGAEAWQVAAELAAAKVPVMTGALNNIPTTFDALGQRQENAALLRAAGVEVSLIGNGPGDPGSFNVRNLRQEAGNAVAYGMSWEDALRAVTLAPSIVLGVEERVGSLRTGRQANVVVWDGDPFEFSTRATHVFIRGVLQTGASRQDELTARYRSLMPGYSQPNTGMPPAGTPATESASTAFDGNWVLTSLTGRSSVAGIDGRAPTLALAAGRASGFGGCNRFHGSFAAVGSSLRFGALATTMMACIGDGDAVERAFHTMLESVRSAVVSGSTLTLRGESGLLARFRRE